MVPAAPLLTLASLRMSALTSRGNDQGIAALARSLHLGLTWTVCVPLNALPAPRRAGMPTLLCRLPSGKEPMQYNPANPLIVQGDRTILLEVDNPHHADARDTITPFAELEKSPEHIHTYRLTPLSLWNAAAAGMVAEEMIAGSQCYQSSHCPRTCRQTWRDLVSRYGRVRLERIEGKLRLITKDQPLLEELARQRGVRDYLGERLDETSFAIDDAHRGVLKQALIAVGYPAEDLAGYTAGPALGLHLRNQTRSGLPFEVRDYQRGAVDAFHAGGDVKGGSGVIVLPWGAGKTIVGLATLAALQTETLVLTTSTTAVEQWRREILDKTDIDKTKVTTYTGDSKAIGPITLATYQIVTYRPKKDGDFPHFGLFNEGNWGLIIYDEVHLLPPPVFRITADIQARRRLGLTATLVREDHREEDVFSLIGPKKYDVPWRVLETKGWIAEAQCHEIRLGLPHRANGVCRGRAARQVPPGQREPRQGRPRRAAPRTARRSRRPGDRDRPVPQAIAADRRPIRSSPDHGRNLERRSRGSLRAVPVRGSRGWSFRRWATSRLTFPTRM